MLYIVGLGLNERGISEEGKEAVKRCEKIYLESYTVDFPYEKAGLEKILGKKIISLKREQVESDFLIKEAKKQDVALLVYGSPLFATTHISLILEAEKEKVKTKIIYNSSAFDAIAETGLQLYKFGKITSMLKQEADFFEYVKENQSIKAHSLILVDIGIKIEEALDKLEKEAEKNKIKLEKIVVCSCLGTEKAKIFYDSIKNLKQKNKKQKIKAPFCFIIPSKLHFLEKEALERFEI